MRDYTMNLRSRFLREMHFPILLISFLTPKFVNESPLIIEMNEKLKNLRVTLGR